MSYSPELGRWMQQDPLGYVDGMNRYEAYAGDPTGSLDPLGLRRRNERRRTDRRLGSEGFFFDGPGSQILDWWLDGSGQERILNDQYWQDYMRNHEGLRQKLQDELKANCDDLASGGINKTTKMEIDNGYSTGYEMLHGTNANVGGFQMSGRVISTKRNPDGSKTHTVMMTYTWNDVIDPNPIYAEDSVLSNISSWFYDPKDYTIRIQWTDEVEVTCPCP